MESMAWNFSDTLAFTDQLLLDVLDYDMKCYQLDNGIIFRFKTSEPQQLLYKEKDDLSSSIISVPLPVGRIEQMAVSGDRLYFNTNDRKVYYVTTGPVLAVRFHRDLNEKETVTAGGISSRQYTDQHAFHRLEYDNYNLIVVSESTLKSGGRVRAIHGSKLVFVWNDRVEGAAIEALGANAIVLSVPRAAGDIYCHDSTPFIYVPERGNLFVLNTATMEPLVALYANGLTNMSIMSVRGDLITFAADANGDRFLMTAKLPEGYFDSNFSRKKITRNTSVKEDWDAYYKNRGEILRQTLNDSKKLVKKDYWQYQDSDDEGSGKMASTRKASTIYYEVKKDWDKDFKINETVNDLLDKNVELEKQIENLKKEQVKTRDNFQDEMLKSFNDSNEKLIKENEQIKANNRESRQCMARATELNEEINAANDQLNEELGIMQEEDEEEENKLNELRERYNSLSEKDGKLTSTGSDKKVKVRERLEKIISENEKLCNSLSGRSNEARINELILENEQIMKNVARLK